MLLVTNLSFAQNETGTRPLTKDCGQFRKIWYDSTNSMFQVKYPIIQSIPPISSDMPIDVILSYIYTDSLVRFFEKGTRKKINSWTTMNDTLKSSVVALYKMVDYNPMMFRQYDGETGLNSVMSDLKDGFEETTKQSPCVDVDGRYRMSPGLLRHQIEEKWLTLLPGEMKNSIKMFSLLRSDYILRVKILSIDSTANKYIAVDRMTNRYKVLAEVIDTIKGKRFQPVNYSLFNTSEIIRPKIEFQYSPYEYNAIRRYTRLADAQKDSAFTNGLGEFCMHNNQEAIVFLTHENPLYDAQNDYFDLGVASECLNAFPIIKGNVRDINHV